MYVVTLLYTSLNKTTTRTTHCQKAYTAPNYLGLHHQVVLPSSKIHLILPFFVLKCNAFSEARSLWDVWLCRLGIMIMFKPITEAVVCILKKKPLVNTIAIT